MPKRVFALCALAILLAAPSAVIQSQDASSMVNTVVAAMGVQNVRTIQITGAGSNAGIGQNFRPDAPWPMVRVKSYTRLIDYDAVSSNAQLIRFQNGADQPQNQVIQPNAAWAQQYDIYLTPVGFLKGAMANPVTLGTETVNSRSYDVITYTVQNRYKVSGYINAAKMVERVHTWTPNDVLGDMLVEAYHIDYKDFAGVKYPAFSSVRQAGSPTLILGVTDVKVNVPVSLPPAQQQAAAPVRVESERIADGVWHLRGGSHHSVLVEFQDHVAVIEAPQNEARSLAVIAEVRRLLPNKPIRYLINTHHHFDHSGGLRTYVDADVTIVTHDINKPFYERVLNAPRTLNPDRLAQSRKQARIETTGDHRVYGDALRTLELNVIRSNPHNDGILVAFLPKEKIIVQVDMFTPPAPNTPPPAANALPNPNAMALLNNLERLKWDFETILPLHGPGKATRADLYAFVNKPLVPISTLLTQNTGPTGAGGFDASIQVMMGTACAECHSLDRIQSRKLSQDAWAAIVQRMVEKGARLNDENARLLIEYLARNYGL